MAHNLKSPKNFRDWPNFQKIVNPCKIKIGRIFKNGLNFRKKVKIKKKVLPNKFASRILLLWTDNLCFLISKSVIFDLRILAEIAPRSSSRGFSCDSLFIVRSQPLNFICPFVTNFWWEYFFWNHFLWLESFRNRF